EAPFRDIARSITRAVRAAGHDVPTIAVCKVRTVAEADAIVARGDADLVGLARAHIADPDLARKAAEGREHETRPCIGCNQGCAGILQKGLPITCLVNPTAGKESAWSPDPTDDPAATPRRLLVIGGGPAGLEAAWVAAARGHTVELWERDTELGGSFRRLGSMPLRRDALRLLDHQIAAAERHGVTIRTATEATVDTVRRWRPDAVVVATGATPRGVVLEDGTPTRTLEEALDEPWTLGDSVALVDLTGEWAAITVAEHLARSGRRVSVITPAGAVAWHVTAYSATALFDRLRALGVTLLPMRRPVGLQDGRLEVEDLATGARATVEADSVVGADYGDPLDHLTAGLRRAGVAVHRVGDALAARTALEAVYEGHEAARAL
ncbi:MAG TPA: FAD-dependent oxidoreductase, partial [Acidimicrobiia bacterium]|nr:FAD-dependent oxidoreductase [Acidimicrobiia bacterium]